MKTRVFKAASLLLTISLLIISLSFMVSAADNEFTEKWQLVTTTPTVVMDGNNPQTVTIQMIVKESLTCYALQGAWDIADSTGNITLTGDVVLNASLPADPNNYAYGAAAGGEMMWVNGQINSPVTLPQGYVFMTATYTVAANTPSGMYKIGFAKTVYAGTDAEPDETSETLEIVIEVVGHTCTFAKYEFDEDSHWQVCECGKMIDNTDWDHDFTNGDCVCGAKAPVTNISVVHKGDVLANAYKVEGNVVTVTHTAACKVGYWDESAGKYIAIAAVANPDGSYSFTAPAGVTEVLLVVRGDVTGDGLLKNGDKNRLNAALKNKTTLTAEAAFAADVTGDGQLKNGDKNRLNAVLKNKTTLTW